jgi:Tol biopolymer transport system component/DNA-binding winged helix-turn-helix (wHTH) protein
MNKRTVRMLDSEPVASSGLSNNGGSGTVYFGIFELDLRTGELRRNGSRVKLQDQPFQVLALLLETPGRVVNRDELRERLWPADTFVDFDHSLNAAIRRLRDALGDTAENPVFVETVARRGYRFLAPVSRRPSTSEAQSVTQARPIPTNYHLGFWTAIGFAAVAFVLLGIKLGILIERARHAVEPQISQLTANPEDDRVRAAAISRDGKYLAFSDERGFYLRQIDTGETHPLVMPQKLKPEAVSWFPDGTHMVVASSASGQRSSLWTVSTLGGDARQLLQDANNPSVSPDGKELTFSVGSKLHQQLWLMDADGSHPRKLAGDEGDLFGMATWSPDGNKIAYTHAKMDYGNAGNDFVEILQIHGQNVNGTPVQLSRWTLAGLERPLAWAPDGTLIYAEMEQPPNQPGSNLWSVSIDGKGKRLALPLRLTSDAGDVLSISLTADGKRIVYVKGVPQPDIYVTKIEGTDIVDKPQRLSFEEHKDLPYDWTTDNENIIFASDRSGILSIYKQRVDEAIPELLVRNTHPLIESRLSPDGTQLIYVEYPNWGESDPTTALMRTPLAGGSPQKLVTAKWITNQQCARAPATICLYSVLADQSLTFFTFDPFKGKGNQVLRLERSFPKFYNWSLSPDGHTLAVASAKTDEQPQIALISLNGAAERSIQIAGWPGLSSLDWAADSKSLWGTTTGEDQNSLVNIDLEGRVRAVWQPDRRIVGWAIPSRNGRFLALHVDSISANAWMLERR